MRLCGRAVRPHNITYVHPRFGFKRVSVLREVLMKNLFVLKELHKEMRWSGDITSPLASHVVTELVVSLRLIAKVFDLENGLRVRQLVLAQVVVNPSLRWPKVWNARAAANTSSWHYCNVPKLKVLETVAEHLEWKLVLSHKLITRLGLIFVKFFLNDRQNQPTSLNEPQVKSKREIKGDPDLAVWNWQEFGQPSIDVFCCVEALSETGSWIARWTSKWTCLSNFKSSTKYEFFKKAKARDPRRRLLQGSSNQWGSTSRITVGCQDLPRVIAQLKYYGTIYINRPRLW